MALNRKGIYKMENTESLDSIQSEYPDLYDWVKSITRYGDFEKFVRVTHQDEGVRVCLWTEENTYHICARLPAEGSDGYLGCIASARKPLAGEDWTRGNDLPDGPYSMETWHDIVNGMLAYELVKVKAQEPQRSTEVHEGVPLADTVVGVPC